MNEISVIDGKRVWIYQRDSLGNNSAKLEEQKQKMLELAELHFLSTIERIALKYYCNPTIILQFCRNQKIYRETCPSAQFTVYLDCSSMCFNDCFRKRKAETNTLCIF